MPDDFSEEKEERYQSYLNIHLKNEQLDLKEEDQVEALHKRYRSKWLHLLVNVAVVCLFGYSFYHDITELSGTVFVFIGIAFVINIGLILYQMRQIKKLISYLNTKKGT